MVTNVQELVLDFARGAATADEVVTAVAKAKPGAGYQTRNHDEELDRMETDEFNEPNYDGWDGVTALYHQGKLSDAQFDELFSKFTGSKKA